MVILYGNIDEICFLYIKSSFIDYNEPLIYITIIEQRYATLDTDNNYNKTTKTQL